MALASGGLLLCFLAGSISSVFGLQCYNCTSFVSLCNTPEYIADCNDAVHNLCQTITYLYPRGRKYTEKKCATAEPCYVIKESWITNGLCHGGVGSQCVECCNGSLCNSYDPTDLYSASAQLHIHPLVAMVTIVLPVWYLAYTLRD